jgi:glycerol-3-phosphate dehydrogenase (NAD(P)+)
LWAYEPATVEEINSAHTNAVYLPGAALDPAIRATGALEEAAACDLILLAVPAQHTRQLAADLRPLLPEERPVVICAKGFEKASGKLLTDVLREALPQAVPAILSGPTFAAEVARNLPCALTLACPAEAMAMPLIAALSHKAFRLYWTDDVTGVQIGGAVKNVLAIAAGIVAGRELGSNAHAALITRGFAELVRFGTKMGGRPETLTGLSGLGDLILTCSSAQSRNMSLGMGLGQGRTLDEILGARHSVSEGVHTVTAVVALAARLGVEMPICEAVKTVTGGEASVDEAIGKLLSRPLRAETGAAPAK